jgi:hypothetical protein
MQEVRGSSPCAPTILFSDLQGTVSSNSGLLLFGQLSAEDLREQALDCFHLAKLGISSRLDSKKPICNIQTEFLTEPQG